MAIPAYPMMCFLFPKTLCHQIDSLIARFWWGNNGDSGIHWMSWSSLGLSKAKGLMGFRDLQDFNQALLAKQGWRIPTNPSAVWARILKARYFPLDTFFIARKGSSASWLWSSLLHGRDLLTSNVAWQIENGLHVPVWHSNWIPQRPEALAVRLGVQLALSIPSTHFLFEIDSLQLVKLLTHSTTSTDWAMLPLVDHIRALTVILVLLAGVGPAE
ncbi:uncharacterized mitochondrial protein AtMg00310-like [Rosa chinensis]|uniref:uncharacterized mitochondrial protein AtMg00310-like n=1 Tax=Rosa chinensis TaxID=74649 RepID=UPI001AD90720|nr:uncharacterized mitochondrial protein AtMg00310-like [Rosa chinensis]